MRSARPIAAGATILLLMSLAACTAKVSVGASSGSGGTKTYSNTQYGFSIAYPNGWQQTGDVSTSSSAGSGAAFTTGFFDPNGTKANGKSIDGIVVSVYQLKTTVTPAMMPQVKNELQGVVTQLSQGMADFVAKPLQPVTVNGVPGYRLEFTATENNVPIQSITDFLFHGDKEYQLLAQASQANWSADQADLQKSLDSFTAK